MSFQQLEELKYEWKYSKDIAVFISFFGKHIYLFPCVFYLKSRIGIVNDWGVLARSMGDAAGATRCQEPRAALDLPPLIPLRLSWSLIKTPQESALFHRNRQVIPNHWFLTHWFSSFSTGLNTLSRIFIQATPPTSNKVNAFNFDHLWVSRHQ